MTKPVLHDTTKVNKVMRALQKVLLRHLDELPDAVVILRTSDGTCRTLFAANPENFSAMEDPRVVMTALLLSAVGQNDMVNEAIREQGRIQ